MGARLIAIGAALVMAAGAGAAFAQEGGAESPFFFRDGDRIVVVGDSITVEGHYVRYLENFIRTRFPTWKIAVRNGGTNGQTAQGALPFVDNDVFVWNPSVVVVNYGMNDGRSEEGAAIYRKGLAPYVESLRSRNLRVVICSNSPLDRGDVPGKFTDYNRNFDLMAKFAEEFARERALPFVDQFHFCHTLWGENRKRESPVPVSDQTLAKHRSDDVHARAPGQLTMAYIILKTLNAPAEVSHASIDARDGTSTTRRCQIRDFKRLEGGQGVSFVRADEASPCWIDDRGALGLELVPFQDELNRMTMRLKGLSEGVYELKIDGQVQGRHTDGVLAEGINLSRPRQSPVYDTGRKVENLINAQRSETYRAREVLRFQPPPWIKVPDLPRQKEAEFSRRLEAVEKRDAEIAAAAAPQPRRFEVVRVGDGKEKK